MSILEEKSPDQQRCVAHLAEQYHVPIDKITQLYEQEQRELAKGARVTTFLHVFVMRHVQEILRKESLARAEEGV